MGHQLVSDPEPVASPSELSFQPLTCEVKRSCGNAQGSTEPFPCPPWYLRKRRGDPASIEAGWGQSLGPVGQRVPCRDSLTGDLPRPPPPPTDILGCLLPPSLSLCLVALSVYMCLSPSLALSVPPSPSHPSYPQLFNPCLFFRLPLPS